MMGIIVEQDSASDGCAAVPVPLAPDQAVPCPAAENGPAILRRRAVV